MNTMPFRQTLLNNMIVNLGVWKYPFCYKMEAINICLNAIGRDKNLFNDIVLSVNMQQYLLSMISYFFSNLRMSTQQYLIMI